MKGLQNLTANPNIILLTFFKVEKHQKYSLSPLQRFYEGQASEFELISYSTCIT